MPAACLQRKGQFYTRNACLRACGASGANGIFSVPPAEPAGMPPFQGLRQPPGKPGAGASHRGGSPPLGHVVLLFKAVYQPHHHFPLAGRKGADVHTVLCGKAKQIIRRCAKHMAQLEQVGKRRKGMPFSHALMALRDTPRRFASTACFISRWLRSCCKRSPNIWFSPPFSMHIITCLFSNFGCKNDIKVIYM